MSDSRQAQREGHHLSVWLPSKLMHQLRSLAAAQGDPVAAVVRDLLARSLRRKAAEGAADPLTDTLHTVLPAHLGPIAEMVAAARFDAIMARELARETLIGALRLGGVTMDRAVEGANAAVGRAAKVAARRLRDEPRPQATRETPASREY